MKKPLTGSEILLESLHRENVEVVFKDGVGYDPAKLRASVHGLAGIR